jgi:nitrite reductase (NO-forming)
LIGVGPVPAGGAAAGRDRVARLTERHVLTIGLALAGAFVALAVVAAASTLVRGGTAWAAIHLAMAGAATVAIGTFMPHFAVTLAGTRPRPVRERLAALGCLAAGAAAVVIGVSVVGGWLAVLGAGSMLIGLGIVGFHVLVARHDPLARRHPVVTLTYTGALILLAGGITIGALGASGLPIVLGAWAQLRPAHVWLALFGAVSLTIFATLVYLAPTVLGARIRMSPWLIAGVGGMVIGPPVAALGFGLDVRGVVTLGIGATALGAIGQAGYVADCLRRRGRFTSEHDWRRVAVGHLVAGPAWFAAAALAALAGILGGDPVAGWSIGALAIPLVAGWMLQELIGSWTHLVPAVTPGDVAGHGRQRRVLAAGSRTRMVGMNVGVAAAWVGATGAHTPVLAAGAALIVGVAVTSVWLLFRALSMSRSGPDGPALM